MENTLSRQQKIELYTKLVASYPMAELKGDTIPYTSLNGHMYSYLSKDNLLALKLKEDVRTAFLEKYNTTLMTAYGIVQKDYVIVPDSLMENMDELLPYFIMSYEYTATLKHKPSKNSK